MKLNIQLFADAEVSIKFNNKVTGEEKLKRYAETLSRINSVLSGLNVGVAKQLDSSASNVSKISKDVDDMSNRVGIAFNFMAISKYAGAIKKLGSSFTSLAKESFDYLENFNLFQVAFNGNYASAERFVNKMSEMYGLDESWVTQTVGKFKQLTNAMNLTAETGEKVSKLLTQMSLDISSLYNVDIDRAASTLSSAMAGQTKPIRGVAGADITQATLQTTLDKLDLDTTVNKLSFAEKRLLIIISLTEQLKGSINDMGRTIESPSNQLRIMNEQWQRLSRAVGNVFLPILTKILPYLNAILMVLTEIINMVAEFVKTFLGLTDADFDYFDEASANTWDFSDGLKSAGANAKKLKQGLRGFDKLNVITTPSSASGGAGGGIGGINPKLLDAFNKTFDDYQKKLTNVKMKATEIRDSIMEWLGFTKQVDEKTGKVSFKFEKITGGTILGALAVGGAIYKGIKAIYTIFSKITGIKLFGGVTKLGKIITTLTSINPIVLGIVAAITILTVAFVKLYKNNEKFRENVNKLVKTIKGTLKPILDFTKKQIENIIKIGKSLINNVIKPQINLLLKSLNPILEAVVNVLQKVFNTLKPIIEKIVNVLSPILEKISSYLSDSLFPVIGKIFEVISKIFEALEPIFESILEFALDKLLIPLRFIIGLVSGLTDIIDWLYNNLVKPFLDFVTDKINKYVIPAIESIGKVVDKIKKAIQKVVDWWNNLSFNKKIISVEGSSGGGHSGGSGKTFASGGLPSVGQMFIANERGPELVGQIGGQSFVANQTQMMDLLDKKIGNAQNNSQQVFNIYLDKDTKLATYVINQMQGIAKTNGKPITIGG